MKRRMLRPPHLVGVVALGAATAAGVFVTNRGGPQPVSSVSARSGGNFNGPASQQQLATTQAPPSDSVVTAAQAPPSGGPYVPESEIISKELASFGCPVPSSFATANPRTTRADEPQGIVTTNLSGSAVAVCRSISIQFTTAGAAVAAARTITIDGVAAGREVYLTSVDGNLPVSIPAPNAPPTVSHWNAVFDATNGQLLSEGTGGVPLA